MRKNILLPSTSNGGITVERAVTDMPFCHSLIAADVKINNKPTRLVKFLPFGCPIYDHKDEVTKENIHIAHMPIFNDYPLFMIIEPFCRKCFTEQIGVFKNCADQSLRSFLRDSRSFMHYIGEQIATDPNGDLFKACADRYATIFSKLSDFHDI